MTRRTRMRIDARIERVEQSCAWLDTVVTRDPDGEAGGHPGAERQPGAHASFIGPRAREPRLVSSGTPRAAHLR